eukprot:1240330-Prymnesium_polylepis.2
MARERAACEREEAGPVLSLGDGGAKLCTVACAWPAWARPAYARPRPRPQALCAARRHTVAVFSGGPFLSPSRFSSASSDVRTTAARANARRAGGTVSQRVAEHPIRALPKKEAGGATP